MAVVLGRWTRGVLHLLVGGACAALVSWLVYGFGMTVGHAQGAARVAAVALVALTLLLVGALLLAPPVRGAEVALASVLLELPLPEPADHRSWASRLRGLAWAVVVVGLGGVSLLALLWCLPQGVWLVVAAFADRAAVGLPVTFARLPGPALVALGLVVAAAGVLLQPLLVVALRRLAPRLLGPTAEDRLAHAEQERRRLLVADELARELHDSIGHALTAIGVQAEAGARVAGRDPAFAAVAFERIAEATRHAVTELDDVLGTLRHSVPGAADDRAGRPAAAPPRAPDVEAARVVLRLVQEGLTNARRHGAGDPRGHVRVVDGQVEVLLENDVAAGVEGAAPAGAHVVATAPGGGRGLLGMRERVELVGGTLEAGPSEIGGRPGWRLRATVPVPDGQADP